MNVEDIGKRLEEKIEELKLEAEGISMKYVETLKEDILLKAKIAIGEYRGAKNIYDLFLIWKRQ